ncbi:MAG: 1-acyl-sn-glycerol-3-phosphate acyltransferase [Ruminococcaceae bacterium]|nr:1-acyl-sn-glycerol-3-phosphate acyltransferase [Oscillospiraceae bacterium]
MKLYKVIVSILRPIFYFLYRIRVVGRENLQVGASVVCCNHTSLLDPVLVALGIGPKYPLHFMGKKELFRNPIANWFFRAVGAFPVDRGNVDLATMRHSINLLKSGETVAIFPEGTRVAPDAEQTDLDGVKTGVAMIAVRGGVPIVPIYLTRHKKLFRKTSVIIGTPIPAEKGEGSTSENYRRIADTAFQAILDLGDGT